MANETKATLLMLSGGPCSLSVLIDLLKNTNQAIFVHHVQFKAADHDATVATKACQLIVDYCNLGYRSFQFSQSKIDIQQLSIKQYALPGIVYESALAAQTLEDANYKKIDRFVLAGNSLLKDQSISDEQIHKCLTAGSFPEEPPSLERTWVEREAALNELPSELSQLMSAQ
ncbi:MAG: hypothetical protein GY815_03040 [Gammaproteobacteria bacterium]|nr:hypothetical protein [Gammaproteobacteria bacterium]